MNHNTSYIKVIRVSDWTTPLTGELPARVVMWKPDDEKARHTIFSEMQYATHIEVRWEVSLEVDDGVVEFGFLWGHYDMPCGKALWDFGDRCRLLGVKEQKLVGSLVS